MSTEARAPLSHDELEEALSTLEDPPEAAEVHGHLLGCLAAGGVAPAEWQARLVAELALEGGTELVVRALEQLHQQAVALLAEQDFGLELLLPGQDQPLADRVEALGQWCQGFLAGYGMSPRRRSVEGGEDADEVEEMLADLSAIAQVDAEIGAEGDESLERDLFEVVEYVRMAALQLGWLAQQRMAPADRQGTGSDLFDGSPTRH